MSEQIELDIEQDFNTLPSHATGARSAPVNAPMPETQEIFIDYRDVSSYRFLKDMYEGSGGVSGKTGTGKTKLSTMSLGNLTLCTNEDVYSYLIPNPTENFYKTRVRSSEYTNNFRNYIDAKYQAVFKLPPQTFVTAGLGGKVIENHPYLDYVKDVNGAGTSKNESSQNLMAGVYRDEVAFLVMDKREGDTVPKEYIQYAESVQGYNTDIDGNLIEITFINELPNGTFIMNEWSTNEVRIYTSDDGQKWNEPEVKAISHIPILAVFAGARTSVYDYLPKPKSYSIASMNLNIYSAESKLDWVIEKQAHDYLWTTGIVDGIRYGVDNMLQIDGTDGASVGVVSPDANKVTVQIARINQKLENLHQMMSEGGVSVTRLGSPESGYSKEFSFTPINDALLHTTMILKAVDNWRVEEYKLYMGGGSFVANTKYKDSFSPKPKVTLSELNEELIIMEERGLADNTKAILKSIVSEIYGDDSTTSILLSEIDNSKILANNGLE